METKEVYEPPDDRAIDKYARNVCEHISEKQNDLKISNSEVVSGLASFLKFAAKKAAKRRNEGK